MPLCLSKPTDPQPHTLWRKATKAGGQLFTATGYSSLILVDDYARCIARFVFGSNRAGRAFFGLNHASRVSVHGSARLHGPAERTHELHGHDGRLELPSSVVRLHGVLEVAKVVLSRFSVPLSHPRMFKQLKTEKHGGCGQAMRGYHVVQ